MKALDAQKNVLYTPLQFLHVSNHGVAMVKSGTPLAKIKQYTATYTQRKENYMAYFYGYTV